MNTTPRPTYADDAKDHTMKILKSQDYSGRTVWHVINAKGDWVQSFATKREAVASLSETTKGN